MYLLGTNIISYLFRQHPRVREKIAIALPGTVSTCSLVTAELFFGAEQKGGKVAEQLKYYYTEFCEKIYIYTYDYKSSRIYSNLKSNLKKQGRLIADFDLMITSICLANDLILVTHNTKHFQNIANLQIEDWTL